MGDLTVGHYASHDDADLTPKQRYDRIQAQIKADNARIKADAEGAALDGAVDAIEDYLGDAEEEAPEAESVAGAVVTKEENDARKVKEAEAEAMRSVSSLRDQFATGHLSEDEGKKIGELFERFQRGEIEDPVLLHLLGQKVKAVKEYMRAKEEVKELNKRLFEQLNAASSNLMKVKGVLEHVDRQLVDYIV